MREKRLTHGVGDLRVALVDRLHGTTRHGGASWATYYLARALSRAGVCADIYHCQNADRGLLRAVRMLPLIRDLLVFPAMNYVQSASFEKRYDVVHIMDPLGLLGFRHASGLLQTCHTLLSTKLERISKISAYRLLFNPVIRGFFSRIESYALKKADRVVCLKETTAQYLKTNLGIDNQNIAVIPNGVCTETFTPSQTTSDYVLFVGRPTVAKGIDIILEYAKLVKRRVIIVSKVIPKWLIEASQETTIEFIADPSREELARIYSEALCLILPSRDEEQPLVVLEAMASGTPVVLSKIAAGGIVKDGINGYILSSLCPEELAEKVESLASHRLTREAMRLSNRQEVLENYSWDIIASSTIDEYLAIRGVSHL